MKVDIVVVYIHRYRRGHEVHFVPPITGIYLVALTPVGHTVQVIHQQVEEVNLDSDADVIALSSAFSSGLNPWVQRLLRASEDVPRCPPPCPPSPLAVGFLVAVLHGKDSWCPVHTTVGSAADVYHDELVLWNEGVN